MQCRSSSPSTHPATHTMHPLTVPDSGPDRPDASSCAGVARTHVFIFPGRQRHRWLSSLGWEDAGGTLAQLSPLTARVSGRDHYMVGIRFSGERANKLQFFIARSRWQGEVRERRAEVRLSG